jgi:hypothetical protein
MAKATMAATPARTPISVRPALARAMVGETLGLEPVMVPLELPVAAAEPAL